MLPLTIKGTTTRSTLTAMPKAKFEGVDYTPKTFTRVTQPIMYDWLEEVTLSAYNPATGLRVAVVNCIVADMDKLYDFAPMDMNWRLVFRSSMMKLYQQDSDHEYAEKQYRERDVFTKNVLSRENIQKTLGITFNDKPHGFLCYIQDIAVEKQFARQGIATYLLQNLPSLIEQTVRIRPRWYFVLAHSRNMQRIFFEQVPNLDNWDATGIDEDAVEEEYEIECERYWTADFEDETEQTAFAEATGKLYASCGYKKVVNAKETLYFREYKKRRNAVHGEFAIIVNDNDKDNIHVTKPVSNPFGIKDGEAVYTYNATFGLYHQANDHSAPERIGIMRLNMYDYDAPYAAGSEVSRHIIPYGCCEGDALEELQADRARRSKKHYTKTPSGQDCYIAAFYIAEPFRRQGYSKALHLALNSICEQAFGFVPQWYCATVLAEDWSQAYDDNGGEPIAMRNGETAAEVQKIQMAMLKSFGFKTLIDTNPLSYVRYPLVCVSANTIQKKRKVG